MQRQNCHRQSLEIDMSRCCCRSSCVKPAIGEVERVTIDGPNDITDEVQLGRLSSIEYEAPIVNTTRMANSSGHDEELQKQLMNRIAMKSGEHQVHCFCGKKVKDNLCMTCAQMYVLLHPRR